MVSGSFPSDRPVTVSVRCGMDPTCQAEHAVTICPATEPDGAWLVETVHDLEAERIAEYSSPRPHWARLRSQRS